MNLTQSTTAPVWFITGCSSGFGRELALLVLRRGARAVVTARDPARLRDIVVGHEDRSLVLRLDVTDPTQVKEAVTHAERHFGGIDVLVNNAGQGYLTSVEEADEADIRDLFELNFFGLLSVTRAALPGMRTRRRGHIVNITSTGGLVGRAGSGYYAATKFAVEGLSEALAQEVAPFGMKVTLVEPGGFRTCFAVALRRGGMADYADTVGVRTQQVVDGHGKQPGDPSRAAQAIMAAVESEHPPLHLVLGKAALGVVRGKLEALEQDMKTWERLSMGVDYPEDSPE